MKELEELRLVVDLPVRDVGVDRGPRKEMETPKKAGMLFPHIGLRSSHLVHPETIKVKTPETISIFLV